jgi:hypothetical protein
VKINEKGAWRAASARLRLLDWLGLRQVMLQRSMNLGFDGWRQVSRYLLSLHFCCI